MKKCPLCEFIYEDEQSLCDMDGNSLVASSEPSTEPKVATAKLADIPARSIRERSRRTAFQAVAGIILAAVLSLVYVVTINRARTGASAHSSTQVAADSQSLDSTTRVPVREPIASPSSADTPAPSESTESTKADASAAEPGSSTVNSSSSKTGGSKSKPESSKRQSRHQNQNGKVGEKTIPEKDSRVGSFLKKAGHILKRPFTH